MGEEMLQGRIGDLGKTVEFFATNPATHNRHTVLGQRASLVRADVGDTTHRFACLQVTDQVFVWWVFAIGQDPFASFFLIPYWCVHEPFIIFLIE